jgi:hypothetical protein
MGWLDRWDVVLLVLSAYVAVMALVRLMTRRRQELVADVERQIHAERKRAKRRQSGDGKSDAA